MAVNPEVVYSDIKRFVKYYLSIQKGRIAVVTWRKLCKYLHMDGRGYVVYKSLLRYIVENELRQVRVNGNVWILQEKDSRKNRGLHYVYMRVEKVVAYSSR